jgi:2-aminoadipate transaminase
MRESAIRRVGDLSDPDLVSLAPGFPDPTMFAWEEIREIAQSILTGSDPSVLQYGPTRGHRPLLEALSDMLADRGIRARPDEVIVTTGSQQALDLCARVLLNPGDIVLVERPTYTGAIIAFGNAQARLVCVDQDGEGINLEQLDAAAARERSAGNRVAFVYVTPNFQNPSGVLTSPERRLRLLEWAVHQGVLIVEDDPYGALFFEDVATAADTRPIKADDIAGCVIYLSTFSKTVAPGFRVAWMAAPRPFIDTFEIAKQATDLCSGALDQRIIQQMWQRGTLVSRLPSLRACYQKKRAAMELALREQLGDFVSWTQPKGGFFLWALFPSVTDTDALLTKSIAHKVAFVPGRAFFTEDRGSRYARLCFATPTPERIHTAVARLAEALFEDLETTGLPTSAQPSQQED